MAMVASPTKATGPPRIVMQDSIQIDQKMEGRIPLVAHIITDDDMGLVQVNADTVVLFTLICSMRKIYCRV
jgi:hypothetical protein